jgi:hypothetical protein
VIVSERNQVALGDGRRRARIPWRETQNQVKDAAEPTNQYPTSGGYRFDAVAVDPREQEQLAAKLTPRKSKGQYEVLQQIIRFCFWTSAGMHVCAVRESKYG